MSGPNTGPKKEREFIERGVKGPSPLGSATFVGLRAVEPLLQYGVLARGLGSSTLRKLGVKVLPAGLPVNFGIKLIDGLGLSPYRLILLSMAVGASAKQIFWLLYISKEQMKPGLAVAVGVFNCAVNCIASFAFTTSLLSGSLSNKGRFPQPTLIVGSLLYLTGIVTETASEIQRKNFKDDPKNKGKVFTGGLWQYARHINYAGYVLWRTGFLTAAGGWTLGAAGAAFFIFNFLQNSIPEIDGYCSKTYGEQWTEYKRKTPYALLPGIC